MQTIILTMNPIGAKIQKLFGRKKNNTLATAASVVKESTQSQVSIVEQEKVNASVQGVKENQVQKEQKYTVQQNAQNFVESEEKIHQVKKELQKYRNLSKRLEQQLQDQQLLEQFYLEQLRQRDQIQKQLKWKLQLIGEQIRGNRLSLSYSFQNWSQSQDRYQRAISADH